MRFWIKMLVIVIVMVSILTVSIGFAVKASPISPVVQPLGPIYPQIDTHQINAQLYGNESATDGFPAYLTEQHTSGIMPNALYITARSPGNSTLSLTDNGTYIMQDVAFNNFLNLSFTIPALGSQPFVITIHSSALNYTRVFYYQGILETPTQFITYEQSLHRPVVQSGNFSTGLILGSIVAGVTTLTAFLVAIYKRKSGYSHTDLGDKLIGGSRND